MKLPRADKSLGQHFLTDPQVIQAITHHCPLDCDGILEIGPGPAILSSFLAQHKPPYWVIEKDPRFLPYLKEHLSLSHILLRDALEVNLNQFCEQRKIQNLWLVSNLPYNISTPLILSFIKCPFVKNMTLMMQKEVGERILPLKNNQMNSLAVWGQTYFEIKKNKIVPPGAFSPPPKVQSIVLDFQRKEEVEIDLREFLIFETFLRKLFKMRRKQLGRVLKTSFPDDIVLKNLEKLAISSQARAETLNLNQIYSLFALFKELL